MDKAKKLLIKLLIYLKNKDINRPIGLKSLGLKVEYFESIYKNHFSSAKFCGKIVSPVQDTPFYFGSCN
ncbi:TPA: hypothetical protein IAD52_05370 [Candidatus Spyradomonas excrementavium]|nr:hypothetical protein [Candidatus Spyradomonas excrementavium]